MGSVPLRRIIATLVLLAAVLTGGPGPVGALRHDHAPHHDHAPDHDHAPHDDHGGHEEAAGAQPFELDGDTILVLSTTGPDGHLPVPNEAVADAIEALDPNRDQTDALPRGAAALRATNPAGFWIDYSTEAGSTIPPAQVRTAIEGSIVEFLRPFALDPHIPIGIGVSWKPLGGSVAGTGGGTMQRGTDGLFRPTALLHQLGQLPPQAQPTMFLQFSSDMNWHLGLTTPPQAHQADLMGIVLHEMGHAFGFHDRTSSVWAGHSHFHPGSSGTMYFDIGGGRLYRMSGSANGWDHYDRATYPAAAPGGNMTESGAFGEYARYLDAPVIGFLARVGWPLNVGLATPTNVTVTRGASSVVVAWDPGLDQPALPAHRYHVTLRANGLDVATRTVAGAADQTTFSGSPNGTLTAIVVAEAETNGCCTGSGGTGGGPDNAIRPPIRSAELEDQVGRLFEAFFQRPPDSAGLAHWSHLRAQGMPLAAIATEFANSTEFRNTYGHLSNDQFVTLIYHNVLGREPDTAGHGHWVRMVNQGLSRGHVMTGFSESNEFIDRTGTVAPSPAPSGSLNRLYQAFFNRLPDTAGHNFWVAQIRAGTPLPHAATEFANSTEFRNTYGHLSNDQFVTLIYHNVLGREPDTAGHGHWVRMLNQGLSRGQVMTGFSESVEYILRTGTLP